MTPEVVIGDTNSSSSYVLDSTDTVVGNITLTSGMWIVYYGANWSKNTVGDRYVAFHSFSDNPSVEGPRLYTVSSVPNSSLETFTANCIVTEITPPLQYQLVARQTSGTTLTVWPFIRALKILSY